ncbi:MAG: M67 family metallopeptidase [Deltaproteobacteria bacterium]|nr:M67 family metallopeptidase [Deltaproteobacteria bacterium]
MIKLLEDTFNKIVEHSKEAYPHECCGVLAGKIEEGKKVVRVYRARNTNEERSCDRYSLDPSELLKIEKDAKAGGFDIIGIYHSHPDHPARPSTFDRERGWPEYSYIIVSVRGGRDTEVKSWTFAEKNEPFREEDIVVERG